MSHFTVLVCLPKDTDPEKIDVAIGEVLAPYDEDKSVEPYRQYEEGSPEDYWWVSSVRRGAEHHRNGTGVKPHYPDDPFGFKHPGESSRETEEQQRAEFADDAKWADALGERPDWETVVRLYNEKYHPGNEVALVGDTSDSSRLRYDAESGRAYQMSTYNPESKWDWWVIGGRWQRHFVAMQGVDRSALIFGESGSFGDNGRPKVADTGGLRCDGGPRYLLDFEAMRAAAEADAHAQYDKWEAICADTPPMQSWEHLRGLADLGEIAIDEARRRYRSQPRVQRADKEELTGFLGDPVEEVFLVDREEFVAQARRAAVPGYALVTLKGEWAAPGRMGWFGMSSEGRDERAAYHIAANTYLDQLDPNAYVVLVDCHI